MTIPMSPARGDTWASGDMGSAPSAIRGARVILPSGVELQLVRNGNGGVLSGTRVVAWKSATDYTVQLCSGAAEVNVAGIVDPEYANKGVTVEDGANFWVVKRGPTYVRTGTTIAKSLSVETHTTDGTIQEVAAGCSNDSHKVLGYTLESTSANRSAHVFVNIP